MRLLKFLPLLLLATAVFAQESGVDPEVESLNEIKKRLQEEKELAIFRQQIAEQEAVIAQQRAAELATRFPRDTTKLNLPEGETSIDEAYQVPVDVLAYSASEAMIAENSAAILEVLGPRRVHRRIVIYSATEAARLPAQRAGYKNLMFRFRAIRDDLRPLVERMKLLSVRIHGLPSADRAAAHFLDQARASAAPTLKVFLEPAGGEPPSGFGPALAAAPLALGMANEGIIAVNSAIQSVLYLAALFRTDTAIHSRKVTINTGALATEYAGRLRPAGVAISYPNQLPSVKNGLFDTVLDLGDLNSSAKRERTSLEELAPMLEARRLKIVEKITQAVAALKPAPEKPQELIAAASKLAQEEKDRLATAIAALARRATPFTSRLDALFAALENSKPPGSPTPLDPMLNAERLIVALENDSTFSLVLDPVTSAGGGNVRIDKNLLFSDLRQLGGAVFATTLIDSRGVIRYSKLSKGYLGYAKVKNAGRDVGNDVPAPPSKFSQFFQRTARN